MLCNRAVDFDPERHFVQLGHACLARFLGHPPVRRLAYDEDPVSKGTLISRPWHSLEHKRSLKRLFETIRFLVHQTSALLGHRNCSQCFHVGPHLVVKPAFLSFIWLLSGGLLPSDLPPVVLAFSVPDLIARQAISSLYAM